MLVLFFVVPLAAAMFDGARVCDGPAARRRDRRHRQWLRQERLSIRTNVAEMRHHSAPQPTYIHVGRQTVSPVIEYVTPAPVMTHIKSLLEPPVPLVLTEYVAPAPAATCAATVSPVTVTEDVAPAPTISCTTPIPVIEHMPAPVIEYIAPPPAEVLPSFYPSVTLLNEAITRLVNPQISISADETSQVQIVAQATPEIPVAEWIQEKSAVTDLVKPHISITADKTSQIVGSFSLLENSVAPVYNRVHQERIVATVQPHVIGQEIPQLPIVEWIQEQIDETIEVVPQERVEEQMNTSSTSTSNTIPVIERNACTCCYIN